MARRRQTPEQVINKPREAEVAIAKGGTAIEERLEPVTRVR